LISVFRYRRTLLILGLAFHGCIALVHGLISFALAMCGALLLFLLPAGQTLRNPWATSKQAESAPASLLDRARNPLGSI
jgi:hypothetical protein